ncbi:Uncharacterized protein PECH_004635 [Penicillium ucsense]|uniref:DUF7624 domain-containing protein n=1 Tax=Penicillium ucsense TaxID=2839758 RepID=A0A8J8VW50_9EURO|nr:Uncharacterized protein PECM_004101 [Penicillium ucsense]KAF7726506.1 Uncharacterized protein PECH_004635 [Penicillium ucsense]
MAVSSPLSVLPYRDIHSSFAGSESMSARNSSIPDDVAIHFADKPESSNIKEIGLRHSHEQQKDISSDSDLTLSNDHNNNHNTHNQAKAAQASPGRETRSGVSPHLGLKIQTAQMGRTGTVARSDEDEAPQSVIHAPAGFGEFTQLEQTLEESCDDEEDSRSATESNARHSADALEILAPPNRNRTGTSPISPPPITTNVPRAQDWSDRATPRAQTMQELEESGRRTRSSSLEDIPEGGEFRSYIEENSSMGADHPPAQSGTQGVEIHALRTALTECWTLCNTLSSLSYINRGRLLRSQHDGMQEDAWRSCWRLCQKLYETRDDDYWSQVVPTLDLCRDFCQALFEVRVCDSEPTDSVLRVSFELNNHLYNTHDRNLPDAFRERTLDFYITLCHRLMKQRTRLTETDSLLSACWALAEMLFSIRQTKREGRELDEELLGSAVQACWELCDIFREGWTLNSMRSSDRGTPRPSQATFAQAFQQMSRQSELEYAEDMLLQTPNPETPTTIFDDTATVSPDEAQVPNILVLGHGSGHTPPHSKWPSNVSNVSEKSRSSGQTASSANTVTTMSEDPNFTRLKVLVTKAAINSGYQRGSSQPLSSFVKSLPSDAFGSAPWQTSLLKSYRKLVVYDPAFRNAGFQARVSAVDMAHACQTMARNGQYSWLVDLYRLVFGFHLEDALSRKTVVIQT